MSAACMTHHRRRWGEVSFTKLLMWFAIIYLTRPAELGEVNDSLFGVWPCAHRFNPSVRLSELFADVDIALWLRQRCIHSAEIITLESGSLRQPRLESLWSCAWIGSISPAVHSTIQIDPTIHLVYHVDSFRSSFENPHSNLLTTWSVSRSWYSV